MALGTRRACARVALLAFCAAFAQGAWTTGHNGPEDDAACGQVDLANSHLKVQFETVKLAVPATHCPFCHWQRVVRGADFADLGHDGQVLEPLGSVLPTGPRPVPAAATDDRFSRGPPAVL